MYTVCAQGYRTPLKIDFQTLIYQPFTVFYPLRKEIVKNEFEDSFEGQAEDQFKNLLEDHVEDCFEDYANFEDT